MYVPKFVGILAGSRGSVVVREKNVRANWIQFEAITVDSRSPITRTSREIEGSSICREQNKLLFIESISPLLIS